MQLLRDVRARVAQRRIYMKPYFIAYDKSNSSQARHIPLKRPPHKTYIYRSAFAAVHELQLPLAQLPSPVNP
jgi:hypothetical protein